MNTNKLAEGKTLFVLQPFMFSDERILTKEEQILSDEHYRYSNKMARKALYEVMPKAYRRFCDIVIMEAKNKKLKVLDLTRPPETMWFYSDTSHFTDEGNRYTAEMIYANIREETWNS